MKNFKKIMTVIMCLALVFAFMQTPVKAEAAEPVTWTIRYDTGSNMWYGTNSTWNYWTVPDLSSMSAGDNVVIDANGQSLPQYAIWAPQPIGELAFVGNVNGAVYAPSVQKAYASSGCVGVVFSNVNIAESYPNAALQVQGNVNQVKCYYDYEGSITSIGVSGTVGQANVKWTGDMISNNTTIYNIPAGKFVTNQYGIVDLKAGEYSLVPGVAATPATGAGAGSGSGKQLDAVPKTGAAGLSESLIFFGLAAVFAIGAIVYKKKVQ